MTVPFRQPDRQRAHRAFRTRRDDPEPRLAELLDDPILQALMQRDGVTRQRLESLIGSTQRLLGLAAAPDIAAELFAECRAAA